MTVVPVVVALDVGFVHHVESVIVEHGIHLGLTWIVASTYGVDIGLLHHRHIAQHRLHVDRATMHGVRILCVDSAEIDALTVKIDATIFILNLAESIFRSKGHFLLTIGRHLCHLNGVEIGLFGRPQLHAIDTAKREILNVFGLASIKAYVIRAFCLHLALRVKQANAHFLLNWLSCVVVHAQTHGYVGRSEVRR